MTAEILDWLVNGFWVVFVDKLDAWVIVGLAGQAAFMSRFLVQWIASERAGRSLIPNSFWILSILGGAILLVYAIYRADPVFIAGQGIGLFVYVRNIVLIRRHNRAAR